MRHGTCRRVRLIFEYGRSPRCEPVTWRNGVGRYRRSGRADELLGRGHRGLTRLERDLLVIGKGGFDHARRNVRVEEHPKTEGARAQQEPEGLGGDVGVQLETRRDCGGSIGEAGLADTVQGELRRVVMALVGGDRCWRPPRSGRGRPCAGRGLAGTFPPAAPGGSGPVLRPVSRILSAGR